MKGILKMTTQKTKCGKTKINSESDVPVVLECLYENYDLEGTQIMSGKNIHITMAYPFFKMLGNFYQNLTIEEIHKELWAVYSKQPFKEEFVMNVYLVMKNIERKSFQKKIRD